MSETESVSLDEQILAVKREIGMRERVYPGWVKSGKMQQEFADRQTEAMRAVLRTLEGMR